MTTATHGAAGIGIVETALHQYRVIRKIGDGEVARVYLGEVIGIPTVRHVAVKVPKRAEDNSLMLNEQGVLESVQHEFLPTIIDRFQTEDDRVASVFELVEGLDLQDLRAIPKHRRGIDPHFHIGWFLERQLNLLGVLHKNMVIHGNLQPKHLLIQGSTHKVVLIDFCWARRNPTQWDRIKIFTEHYSAPEIKQDAPPLPGMDIYSLGKCAVYLLGGNPENGRLPATLDDRIRQFIEEMIEPNYLKRPRDAWVLARKILKIRREVFGPPQWVELET